MADFLVINSSPRADGNCSFLSSAAVDALDVSGVETLRLDLARMKIAACSGCGLCVEKKARYCVFKDDMADVYKAVLEAKALLFVSPIYWFTYSAQLKTAIDRFYGLWNWEPDFLKDKRVGAVFVYGDTDVYASGAINAIGAFEHMLRFLEARGCGFAYGTANDPGDAAKNADLVERVKQLATSMATMR
jgi:multimeric flavodoxin WrbA